MCNGELKTCHACFLLLHTSTTNNQQLPGFLLLDSLYLARILARRILGTLIHWNTGHTETHRIGRFLTLDEFDKENQHRDPAQRTSTENQHREPTQRTSTENQHRDTAQRQHRDNSRATTEQQQSSSSRATAEQPVSTHTSHLAKPCSTAT